MAGKKALKARVEKLSARLDKARARGDRWKARAKRAEQDAVELRGDLKKVKKRQPPPPPADAAAEVSAPDVPERPQPDRSWTVARLREEAKSRGLTGVTTKSKDQLLVLLRAE